MSVSITVENKSTTTLLPVPPPPPPPPPPTVSGMSNLLYKVFFATC